MEAEFMGLKFVLELIVGEDWESPIPYDVFKNEEEAEEMGTKLIEDTENNYSAYQVIPLFENVNIKMGGILGKGKGF